MEQLLKTTIETAVAMGTTKKAEFERVIVDTTVQEKAVAFPTRSRPLEVARAKGAQLARRAGILPKQTYEREGKSLRRRAGGCAHAKQFKRLRRGHRRQRIILGRPVRDVRRKMTELPLARQDVLEVWLQRAECIQRERQHDKNELYALRAPEVECIGKGKARQPYEFGVKTSLAITHKSGLVVCARTFPGKPYDGHTLAAQIEQTSTFLQDLEVKPTTAVVDLDYRGVDHLVPVQVVHRGRAKTMSAQERRWLKRRQAIEPVIGHLDANHGMRRCWLKGDEGDALIAVLCAAGFNIRWLLRAIARLGLRTLLMALIEVPPRAATVSMASTGVP